MFYHIQSSSLLVKCVYRLTVVTYPSYTQIWKKYYLFVYAAVFVYSAAMTVPYAFVSQLNTITYNSTTESLEYHSNRWGDYAWILDFQVVAYLLATVGIGAWTMRNIKKNLAESDIASKTMRNIIAFDVLIHVCVAVSHCLFKISMGNYLKTAVLFCVSDLISLSTPYNLFLCDKNFRKIIIEKLRRKSRISRNSPPTIEKVPNNTKF
ncbi:unnamed protein product [Caenorhabditis sp. 36 PRJEB53466]|nr:unnamed protein product [Caenorhabditis sp. 36 PRJEB53466]